ncbi:hypothetical protein ACCO45_006766 [Purpureocillium lilacinum]|uniref:Uncharacterized protein n=1 Tax=Purpureocillium lilacinum TaxID=33203 RepID=A0ACC4DSU3_PURLI
MALSSSPPGKSRRPPAVRQPQQTVASCAALVCCPLRHGQHLLASPRGTDLYSHKRQRLPLEDEGPKEGAEDDAHDDVNVEVHGQLWSCQQPKRALSGQKPADTYQHEKVRDRELEKVQEGADRLLEDVGPEGRHDGRTDTAGGGGDRRGSVLATDGAAVGTCALVLGDVLADEEAVELLDGAADELERHGEEEDADAGTGEHAARGDVPLAREEARVDGVEVEEHLQRRLPVSKRSGHVSDDGFGHLTEILQLLPPPMPMPPMSWPAWAPEVVAGMSMDMVGDMEPMVPVMVAWSIAARARLVLSLLTRWSPRGSVLQKEDGRVILVCVPWEGRR